ncbi:hypothetical protein BD779DRAFT_1608922 [Infundibulicybe gibba]|nr:hypothetical protein BD779DRAFT_1608922 [Infundibulicybe gibba]
MKRSSLQLVSYDSDSPHEEDEETKTNTPPSPPMKKRKLPPLASSLVVPKPIDDPAQHQGRTRSQPHVEGQFAAHVYISITLPHHASLHALIRGIAREAQKTVPALHSTWLSADKGKAPLELHISLSRPTFLWAHQREELKRAVKALAATHSPFPVSFSALAELTNDERTRTFLTIEVGAGHRELKSLADALTPTLQSLRQKPFYPDARFHASIAWALLSSTQSTDAALTTAAPTPAASSTLSSSGVPAANGPEFSTVPRLPAGLTDALNTRHAAALAGSAAGGFPVEAVSVKIGREVCTWNLIG